MTNKEIIELLDELIGNCEGAIMASRGGTYLRNFAFMVQERLRSIALEIEREMEEE